jgi:hypothetical protein
LMAVIALPSISTFCPWERRERLFSTMLMRAPVFARNHASVGPAMPDPLIRTRMASFNVVESVRERLGS